MKRNSKPDNGQKPTTLQNDIKGQLERVHHLSTLIRRSQLMSSIGKSFDGERDLYTVLGYPVDLNFENFTNIYDREGIPKRVNDAPCNALWRMPPRIFDVGEAKLSTFETAWHEILENLGLWNKFNRADKLLGFGEYSVLVLGFKDAQTQDDLAQPVKKNAELLYIQCFSSEHAQIDRLNRDPADPRFGLPELYKVHQSTAVDETLSDSTSLNQSFVVHWDRVIHLVEDNLFNEVFGNPRLENPYNRLIDIDKIVGGSAEMYWKGARPGYHAAIDPEAQWDEDDPTTTTIKSKLDDFEHGLRRTLLLQGIDITALETQVSDPSAHLDAQLQIISASTGIPKRILTGSERGELASSQDRANWDDVIEGRRIDFGTPIVIRQFIDRLIEIGTLPTPENNEYTVDWPNLRTPSDKEKAEVGKIRADAIKSYTQAPGASTIWAMESFLRKGMGFTEEESQEALLLFEVAQAEEEEELAEEERMRAAGELVEDPEMDETKVEEEKDE